jgi:hypothetical protein
VKCVDPPRSTPAHWLEKLGAHFDAKYRPEYRFWDIQPTYKAFRIINRPILGHLHAVEIVGSNPVVPITITHLNIYSYRMGASKNPLQIMSRKRH